MSTPSLLNIPYRVKGGVSSGLLYSQIPETGAGDFTVTRATTPTADLSTRINSQGFIEVVPNHVARLDYPLGGAVNGCPALLVEPSAQNLVLQSQAFNVTWSPVIGGTGVNPAITANAVISPDGTQNAETVVFNRGAGNLAADQSILQQNITIPTTGAYIFSVYAKASTAGDIGKQVFIRIGGAGSLTPITLTANWVRYSRAETSVASGSQAVQIGNRGTFTADNSVSVDLWGAQAEAGSVATSYIPTTTQAITRAADTIVNTTATALIGQSEGTIYWDIAAVGGVITGFGNPQFGVRNSAFTNWIGLTTNVSPNVFRITANATTGSLINYQSSITSGKAALAWSSAGLALYVNGSLVATSATNPNFSFSRVDIIGNMTFKANAFALYPTRIPNTAGAGVLSLATLTAP